MCGPLARGGSDGFKELAVFAEAEGFVDLDGRGVFAADVEADVGKIRQGRERGGKERGEAARIERAEGSEGATSLAGPAGAAEVLFRYALGGRTADSRTGTPLNMGMMIC